MVHHNIRIEDNEFRIYDYPVLTARSTGNLSFTRNRVTWLNNFLSTGAPRPAFRLTACEGVKINGNEWQVPFKPMVLLQDMKTKTVKTDLPVEVRP